MCYILHKTSYFSFEDFYSLIYLNKSFIEDIINPSFLVSVEENV